MSELALLETDRLVLSGWRRDQIDDLVRLHTDPTVARYLSHHGKPWSMSEIEEAIDEWIRLFDTRRLGKLRVTRKADGVLLGRAGFGVYGPKAEPEIGYSLFPQFWGNGYAVEAAAALRDWLFRETNEPMFWAMADLRNAASLKVLERIGMSKTHVGELTGPGILYQYFILRRPT